MATALKFKDIERSASTNHLAPIRADWPYPEPTRYIFRELSMECRNGLQFFYKDPGLAQPLPGGGIAEVVAQQLAARAGGGAAATGMGRYGLAAAAAGNPPQQTPLDLKVIGTPTYIVLALDPQVNWHFDSDDSAISLKDIGATAHYGGLRHVLADGSVQAAPGADCRIVYFAASPPEVPENGQYRHGLNFHVQLTQNSSGHSSTASILPIIIDPDVGYPGGSNT